jgi:hypothetical protein
MPDKKIPLVADFDNSIKRQSGAGRRIKTDFHRIPGRAGGFAPGPTAKWGGV